MGKTKRLDKQNFLKKHPFCCFCGGTKPAEEIDHVPGRVFFRDRQWPDGYIFPACIECNRATRYEEKVIALLCRFNNSNETEIDHAEFEKMAREVARHDPEFISDIRPLSANETRRFLRDHNIEKPTTITTAEIPIVKIGDIVNKSVRKFGRKLFLALWFKHTGMALPKSGAMRIVWMTNASPAIDDTALIAMFNTLNGIPPIIKNSRHLHDQFTYRYVVTATGDGAGFFVWFRQSFGLLCTMAVDKSMIKNDPTNIEVPF
ncbi:MAG: hypothetical protein M0P59_08710 [Gallionella sp.]|jgi:hypothetical protein|nr:hypothetical protein [Gallionella sp.]MCK9354230.1 hypothetical protein [Gallionella sp.]